MAVLLEHTSPVMRTGAGLHADEARWQLCDQPRQLIPRNTWLDEHRFAGLVHTVNSEYILGRSIPIVTMGMDFPFRWC
jgi:hypothetical protein